MHLPESLTSQQARLERLARLLHAKPTDRRLKSQFNTLTKADRIAVLSEIGKLAKFPRLS